MRCRGHLEQMAEDNPDGSFWTNQFTKTIQATPGSCDEYMRTLHTLYVRLGGNEFD
jgi:hypothetical protein